MGKNLLILKIITLFMILSSSYSVGYLQDISVNSKGVIAIILKSDKQIYMYNGSSWVKIPDNSSKTGFCKVSINHRV